MTWTYSHTQLEKFGQCPQRYRLHYVEGLAGDEAGIEAQWGIMLHDALANWLWLPYAPYDMAQSFNSIPLAVRESNPAYSLRLAEAILADFKEKNLALFDAYDVVCVEQPKVIEIGGYRFTTKPDWVLKSKLDGSIIAVDAKTSRYYKPLEPFDTQQLGQAIAWDANFMARQHVLLKFPWKGDKAKWEFKLDVAPVSKEHVLFWKSGTYVTIKNIEQLRVNDAIWPKRSSACHAFRTPCPFLPLCRGNVKIDEWPKKGD